MTFGEKVLAARLALNLSQAELAEKTGISERSLYTYEQLNTMPHTKNLKKLADALNVTVTYLMDEEESDRQKNIDQDIFLANVRNEFGSKGAREASLILERAAALFAGGELEDEAKVIFFQSLMEVYFESKAEAKEKFAPKSRRVKRKALNV
ncbi:MAG: helix-turn-helix domain-containing protein [Oscillospiraceae bacterium]|jgi:transcriptional regulator with XRE-family HTH domain|nr:helix-turn-helix domain-containing protein [Oscillospiraceae bacterium]